MPRTVIIRIVVDNKDAINKIREQREAQKLLQDQTRFNNEEMRKAEQHALKLAEANTKAASSAEKTTESFGKWFIKLRLLNSTYNLVTNAIKDSVRSYADLELSLAKVASVTGNSKEQVASLQNTIYSLARTTAVSSTEIAGAALELSKLGFEGKALEDALGGVTKLSAVLGDSLETTGNIVGGVIQTFDLSAEEAAKVADKLFVATGKSATNIEGFRIAFALAGNVAHDAGISFDELSAVIATLSNQGIRASTIGTGLRNFIAELSKEGSKAQQALGGSIEDLGLVGAMTKLSELKLKPGSLVEIFGKPGAPVASGLSHANEAYNKFIDSIRNSEGVLEDTKGLINNTLIGSIQLLTNNFNELFQTTASPAATAFKNFFLGLSDDLSKENEYQAFLKQQRALGRDPADALGIKRQTFEDFNGSERRREVERFLNEQKENAKALKAQYGVGDAYVEQRATQKDLRENPIVKQTKLAKDNTKEVLDGIQKIRLAFQEYDHGGTDPFDFKKSEEELAKIRDHFKDIGKNDKANQAESLIGQLKAYEQKDANEGFRKNKAAYEEDKSLADAKRKNITVQNQDSLGEMDQYLVNANEEVDNFNLALELTKLSFNEINAALNTLSSEMVDSLFSWEWSWTHFGYVVKDIFKNLVKDFIAMEVRVLALKAAIKIGGYVASYWTGGASIAASDVAGEALQSDIERNFIERAGEATTRFGATGFDGYVGQTTRFIAGESGMERVTITPKNKPEYYNSPSGGGMMIVVQGDIYNAEKFIDKINKSNELSNFRYV